MTEKNAQKYLMNKSHLIFESSLSSIVFELNKTTEKNAQYI